MRTVTLELQKANTNMINCVIELLDWDELFEGKKVHDQFWLFSKIILKIFHSFIPNKTITSTEKDPSWFNDEIRHIVNNKSEIRRHYLYIGKLPLREKCPNT